MIFKSHKQPFCRSCGKPIKKHTRNYELTLGPINEAKREFEAKHDPEWHTRTIAVDSLPQTKAKAQLLVNTKIVSISRRNYDGTDRGIDGFTTWDGESYRDEFFCNRTQCAVAYAYMAVQSPNNKAVSVAYADSIREQLGLKVR